MNAKIVGFRGSRREMYSNYAVIETSEKNIAGLIGRKVVWKTKTGKTIAGKILRIHGKRLLAKFGRGLPGNAVGSEVEVKP
ncbi:MAG: 50S ribosomal protein L35ae [Candidatus Hydrothermarchaeota archaeon]|nr:50S ribosomal protein L35ae [Candidatus Hydrothermarchaeota archaeon]